ncbi:uncharacterized protein LOC113170109 [Anabas testudineus]|uniref:uncharacterized protein LOC113170109 n=1 Tax=Anabas testudineus TaxID=64144 RepID=UPI000E455DB0|nr:uncharacterized protein LOC113170109 [Anabas testudineus]
MSATLREYCKFSHRMWYEARPNAQNHSKDQKNIYLTCVDWFCDHMLPAPLPLNSTQADPVETPIQEANITHSTCLCSNGDGQFMGLSRCEKPVAGLTTKITVSTSRPVNITFKDGQIVSVHNSLHAPAYKGIPPIENFYWFCGAQAFLFLPSGWSGCCYFVNLTIVNLALVPVNIENTMNHVHKREMAQFANIDSYHWRVSLGEKWGIGLFPWYGVTFLADHIDNITYSMSAFANETIKAFHYLAANDKSHRLTLLKHEMALDYLLAKTGGICLTLNLTGEACVTLIPDNSDNVTTVITALEKIRDAFGPSESAGFSFNKWLIDNFGPWGAGIVQLLIPVVVVFGLMICFCTCSLTCMRALIYKWIGGILGQEQTSLYVKIPTNSTDTNALNINAVSEWAPGNPFSESDIEDEC